MVDKGGDRKARGLRRAMALPIASRRLNIAGVTDLAEFPRTEDGREIPYPVEYKRGRSKPHRAGEVQICAQALYLEEPTGTPVPEGALFLRRDQAPCRPLTGRGSELGGGGYALRNHPALTGCGTGARPGSAAQSHL